VRIAVSGKGGVGKTTLSAMLAGALAMKGRGVIALDADPDANLASALGLPADEPITPLAEMRDLIKERTGSTDSYGGYFKLNPKVDDIPEKYARHIGPIHLLTLGGISKGGGGCVCPATALIKALLTHLVLGRDESIIMDMEAGIEHLGRATAQAMDALVVVVNASPWSAQTARKVKSLAGDLGMKKIFAVGNRLATASDVQGVRDGLGDVPLIGRLPVDERLGVGIIRPTNGGVAPCEALKDNLPAVENILSELESRI